MARYVRGLRPRAWLEPDYDYALAGTNAVHPVSHPTIYDGPVDTGIIDKDGNTIMRMPDEVGFYAKDRPR